MNENSELQIFENPDFGKVRVIEVEGEVWMVGKDVAESLGYSNPRDAIYKHVDSEDKGVANCDTPSGTQKMTIINESGLYSLVLSSKLPGARKFRHWVTDEVLPSIRKTGAYAPKLTNEEILSKAFLITHAENERNKKRIAQLEGQIAEYKEKVLCAGAEGKGEDTMLVGDFAKFLAQNGVDTGRTRFFEQLRQDGYLIKFCGDNVPTLKSRNLHLFRMHVYNIHVKDKTEHRITLYLTPAGQSYFLKEYLGELL